MIHAGCTGPASPPWVLAPQGQGKAFRKEEEQNRADSGWEKMTESTKKDIGIWYIVFTYLCLHDYVNVRTMDVSEKKASGLRDFQHVSGHGVHASNTHAIKSVSAHITTPKRDRHLSACSKESPRWPLAPLRVLILTCFRFIAKAPGFPIHGFLA